MHALREAQTSTSQRAPEDAESIELKLIETQDHSPSNNLKSEESSAVEEVQKL